MKRSGLLGMAVLTAMLARLDPVVASDGTYLPDSAGGSGAFSSATRWKDGVVPGKGDMAFFNPDAYSPRAATIVTLTDEDWPFVSQLGRLQMRTSDVRLTLDFSQDHDWDGQIYGSGTIIKLGTGAFRMTQESTVAISASARFIVSNGTFKVGKQYQNLSDGGLPIVEVQSPGVFELPSASSLWLRGLTGDGSVTCAEADRQLVFMGSDDEFVFSGKFLKRIGLTMGTESSLLTNKPKSRQYFTGTDYAEQAVLRLYAGRLGAKVLGVLGSPSSIGGGSDSSGRRFQVTQAGYPNADSGIVNLGTEPQTTDRIIRFMNSASANGYHFTFDGGAYGAVTHTGEWQNPVGLDGWGYQVALPWCKDHVTPVCLTGENAGGPCVLAGAVYENVSTNHLFFIKRGGGAWRFAHNTVRQFKTPIAIERGTLEYESIAEAGSSCSLGLATVLSTNWTGTTSAYIPYAILLGDGSVASIADLATFRYVGTAAASCSTRPIGIVGAGRILDDNADASVRLSGVSAATPAATLVLDGSRSDSVIENVTNGVGVLSVEKRGTGTWTLSGASDLTGALDVKQGVLNAKIAPTYRWYRLTLKKVYGAGQYNFYLGKLAFFSADNENVALNLEYNSAANGSLSKLQPGQCAFGMADVTASKTIDALFTEGGTEISIYRSATPVVDGSAAAQVKIVLRLPDGAASVTHYDIGAGWYTHNNVPFARTPTDWSLEASADGATWQEVDSQENVTRCYYDPRIGQGNVYWLSDATLRTNPSPTGFAVATEGAALPHRLAAPASLAVASGATFGTDAAQSESAAVTIRKLVYNAAEGAGTVSGVTFAGTGVLEVAGEIVRGQALQLPYVFMGCTGIENLANWQVSFGGQLKPGYTVAVKADGLEIVPPGAILIVR